MLYDKRWEKPVKADPSLAGLIAWLETKDPDGRYEWASLCEPCLIEQYCASLGISKQEVFRQREDDSSLYDDLSTRHDCLALAGEHTFGAALERARAALNSRLMPRLGEP